MKLAYWITTLGGAGLSKYAPGTIGSMVSLFFWVPFLAFNVPAQIRFLAVCLIFFLGIWSIQRSRTYFKGEDPKSIVIDEAAGMGITICLCQPNIENLILGFLLFRFFDVLKPWPVNLADQHVKGSLGIMLDDILAGIYALMILFVFEKWISPLFGSII